MKVPIGIYAFTSDGVEVGEVVDESPVQLRVAAGPARVVVDIPGEAASHITAGKLVLNRSAAELGPLLVSAGVKVS